MVSIFAFGVHLATCVFQQTTCIHDFVTGSPTTISINDYIDEIEGTFMGSCDAPADSSSHDDTNECVEIYAHVATVNGQQAMSLGSSSSSCNDGFWSTEWDLHKDTLPHSISYDAIHVDSGFILTRGYQKNITYSSKLFPITITLFGVTFNGYWGRLKSHIDSCARFQRVKSAISGSGGSGN